MQKASEELGDAVDIQYFTTPTYDSAGIQSSFDAAKLTDPDGMFLQVVQPTQLVAQTKELMQAGVPVVGASPQDPNQLLNVYGADFDSTPIIDEFVKSIPENGVIATIGGQSTVPQVTVRFEPLLEAIKQQRPDVKVLPVEYTDFDTTKAAKITSALIVAHPDLTTIIGSNSPDASGVMAAVKQAKLEPGAIDIWAWDANPDTVQGVRDGYISHLYSQGALGKGYDSVKELVEVAQSNPPGQAITPKAEADWYAPPLGLLTKDNIDTPEAQEYLAVNLDECPYKG